MNTTYRPIQGELTELSESPESNRISVYSGYSFGMSGRLMRMGVTDLISGVVVTPKWVESFARDFGLDEWGDAPRGEWDDPEVVLEEAMGPGRLDPRVSREGAPALSELVILDNGAFPAWRRGEPLDLEAQLEGLTRALARLPGSEWIVAPDVVGDGPASWARTLASLRALEPWGLGRVLLAVQEDMNLEAVAALARELGGGVFVGGETDGFKVHAARRLARLEVRWLHVGRVSKIGLFQTLAGVVDSVDTTSFVQTRSYNLSMEPTYRNLLVEHASPRRSPTQDGHAP